MIAMLLGSLLIAGAVKIFSSNTQAFRLQQQVSSVQENARLTMELLQADLRRRGREGRCLRVVSSLSQGWNDWAAAGSRPGSVGGQRCIASGLSGAEAMTDCEGNAAPAG
jgi:Tfp pilus assembly protein PilW